MNKHRLGIIGTIVAAGVACGLGTFASASKIGEAQSELESNFSYIRAERIKKADDDLCIAVRDLTYRSSDENDNTFFPHAKRAKATLAEAAKKLRTVESVEQDAPPVLTGDLEEAVKHINAAVQQLPDAEEVKEYNGKRPDYETFHFQRDVIGTARCIIGKLRQKYLSELPAGKETEPDKWALATGLLAVGSLFSGLAALYHFTRLEDD